MAEDHILDFEKPVYDLEHKIGELKKHVARKQKAPGKSRSSSSAKAKAEIKVLEKSLEELKKKIYSQLTPWEKTAMARHPHRPLTSDYIEGLFTDFIELHGDRRFADDHAIIGGFAVLIDRKVMVIGHQRGRDIRENMKRNFGMANPEGYRKALRLMKLAEKFGLPVITFVDTKGAYPGIGAEERGQAEAIAYNLEKMSSLKVPIITVVTGEGGSGGALGIAVADRVLMLENSVYSVISPEGCAAILWKDSSKASEAAESLSITADRLLKLGLIDRIIREPLGGAHRNPKTAAASLKKEIVQALTELDRKTPEQLTEERYMKFRKMGEFFENEKLVSSRTS